MRLGQLARHLNISPSEIRDLLLSLGYALEAGTNSRLSEMQIRSILTRFAPEKIQLAETLVNEADQPDPVESVSTDLSSSESKNEHAELPETIRAPKVELQGLKVLGKIDLPESKKKPAETPQESSSEPQETPKSFRRRELRPTRPWINPLEKQRQREAREAEEQKRRQSEKRKELRTAAYLNRQTKFKSIQKNKLKGTTENKSEANKPVKPRPTSLIGRLWHWLTHAE